MQNFVTILKAHMFQEEVVLRRWNRTICTFIPFHSFSFVRYLCVFDMCLVKSIVSAPYLTWTNQHAHHFLHICTHGVDDDKQHYACKPWVSSFILTMALMWVVQSIYKSTLGYFFDNDWCRQFKCTIRCYFRLFLILM